MWWLAPVAAQADPGLTDQIHAAIVAGCSEAALAPLRDAAPAAVRAALGELAAQKATTTGWVTHEVGTYLGAEVSYQLWLPPGSALPALVVPAHPTWPPPQAGEPLPERSPEYALLVIHVTNAAFDVLSERAYRRRTQTHRSWQQQIALYDRAITDALQRYPLDPGRLTCTGVSASGNACWGLAEVMPDRWAGVWPISAGWHPRDEARFGNHAHTPFRIQHGDADPLIPNEWPEAAAEVLTRVGNPPTLIWLSGGRHGARTEQNNADGIAWSLAQQRPTAPETIHWGLSEPTHPSLWWLHADKLTLHTSPRTHYTAPPTATIDARWVGGEITVDTDGVSAMELRWATGTLGPGRGQPGDTVTVVFNGTETTAVLREDPTVSVEGYCETGTTDPMWTGRIRLPISDD